MSQPNVIAAIFARGGSKGVPGKNIRELCGKPLIAWAIETAKASRYVTRLIVSTDSDAIADVARRYGAEVPFMRPAELARDDSSELDAWKHAIREVEAAAGPFDALVTVPATSPLRITADVDAAAEALLGSDADVVITVTPADRNPYYNMVIREEDGSTRVVIPSGSGVNRRQAAPEVFDVTTVAYAARPRFVLQSNSLFEGKVHSVVVPRDRALDIDTELDFRIAEFMMKERLGR